MTRSKKPVISVAPMMDCTDRHDRYFLRLIAKDVLLYTEMVTTGALIHGDWKRFLRFDAIEHPVALQLGGSDPAALAQCARMGEAEGYDEINLNVGCPSDRVKSGRFGACLMLEPLRVAECVAAMVNAVKVPVTVKCRIGVDDHDSYESLVHFVSVNAAAGCNTFIVHARKAWLQGLSPKENREIPPLQYAVVHQLKRDFPELQIILNGGITTTSQISEQLQHVDGIMTGREAYHNPWFLYEIQQLFFGDAELQKSREEIIDSYIPYVEKQLGQNIRLSTITRHLSGLFKGQKGGRVWRRFLSENACRSTSATLLQEALQAVKLAS